VPEYPYKNVNKMMNPEIKQTPTLTEVDEILYLGK